MELNIEQLIGQRVAEVRYYFNPENEYNLQEYYSIFKLENGMIFQIPNCADQIWDQNNNYLMELFSKTNKIPQNTLDIFKTNKIVDFHFSYFNDAPDDEGKSIIEFDNKIFLTEKNYGPIGITDVDMKIMTEEEFLKLKVELEPEFQIKSYVNEIRNAV